MCARSNYQSNHECLKCTGAHQAVLVAVGCAEPELESHCYTAANDTFVSTLQSWRGDIPDAGAIAKLFSAFTRKFNKRYTVQEKAARLRSFTSNVLSIVRHNTLTTSSDEPEETPSWTLTLNELSDRNASELMLTHAMDTSQLPQYNHSSSTPAHPDELLGLGDHAQCSFYQWVGCRDEIFLAGQACTAAVQQHACIAEELVTSGCGMCYLRSAGVPATDQLAAVANASTGTLRLGTESSPLCKCISSAPALAPAENGTAARPALGPQMSPSDGMGFDMDTLKTLTLGNGDISGPALAAFCNKTHELIFAVWSSDRSNPRRWMPLAFARSFTCDMSEFSSAPPRQQYGSAAAKHG